MKEHRLTFSMSLLQKLRHRGLCVGCLENDELLWESLILCRQVQDGVGRNLPRMLSVSRQIATQRLDGLLASAKQCVEALLRETAQVSIWNLHNMFCSDKTDTLTQNIKTVKSKSAV